MSSPILPVQGPVAQPTNTTAHVSTEIGDVGSFSDELAGGVSALNIDAARGGPPPEVLDQIAAAAAVADELRDNGYQMRFFPGAPGERVRIELHDADGQAVSTLSCAEAIEMASGSHAGSGSA
jgi:hypothetical protein